MISRLVLTNWRAYEHVELDLKPGTTFLLARNGIGKSSLIEGATWALYGDAAGRPVGAVRLGSDRASATVDVTLPDGRKLTVTRQLPQRLPKNRKAPVSATVDGRELSEAELDSTIRKAFQGDPAFLARVTMLRGREHLDPDASTLNLQEHLCQFFGIDGLQDTLVELNAREKQNDRRIRDIKQAAGVSTKQLNQLREHHQEAVRLVTEAEHAHQQALDAANTAIRAKAETEAFSAWQLREHTRQATLATLSQEVAAAVGFGVTSDSVAGVLNRLEAEATEELDALRRRRGLLEGRIEAVQTAMAELDDATGVCPVCRRPLSAEDAARARASHLEELSAMRNELVSLDDSVALAKLQSAREFLHRLRQLAPREEAPPAAVFTEEAAATLSDAQAAVEPAMALVTQRRAAAMVAAEAMDGAESEQHASELLEAEFRALALVRTASDAVRSTINTVLDRTIDPLAREVAGRWKRLFGDRGPLVVSAQGVLSREVNDERLLFDSFSTGEKIGAQLLLRLMVLNAATQASFCWVDEPLEHLDPDARRQVASMLASTPSSNGVAQVLVTTYEEPLVRRLATRMTDEVHLVYVRAVDGGRTE
jgi:DNA repair exonuclease SbcCD ATPase subunit